MTTVAIIGVDSELPLLKERLMLLETEVLPACTLWRGRWSDHDVWLIQTEVGKVNAAMASQSAIYHCPTRYLKLA
ncbi:MAG TPA: hypothetical protein EYP04_11765 [Anaerolineae bacterium]|nr:hypothetical protein [Anaerolineae bacterium]HIQ05488.1 hypothetical protein [Anaerolineae bacterium]